MITIDTTNMCSHLQRKLFEEDGIYHSLWIAMQDDPELTAAVRSRQLHIYRNCKRYWCWQASLHQRLSERTRFVSFYKLSESSGWSNVSIMPWLPSKMSLLLRWRLSKRMLPNSANTMVVSCGNWTLLLMKQGIFPRPQTRSTLRRWYLESALWLSWNSKEKAMIANALLYYLIVINIVTFLVYGIDKWKAKQGSWRISEATLLILAVIGGSIGALLGMRVWHHKTMHKKFKYGLPLILLVQIALIYLILDC